MSHPLLPFGKEPTFIVRSPSRAVREFITPTEDFFVRSHAFEVPRVDVGSYTLDVGGLVRKRRTFSLDELRSGLPTRQLTATLQCAGNRRDQLIAVEPITGEVPWSIEAISNATWEGVRLCDVLDAAGVNDALTSGGHVEFTGLDQIDRHGERFGFGGSIPLEK